MSVRTLSGTQWIGRMSDEEYHSDPCTAPSLSSSMAKILDALSPAHAYQSHPQLGGGGGAKRTKATDRGTITHAYIMGTDVDHIEVMPEETKDFRTKDAQFLRDIAVASGKVPLLYAQHLEYRSTCEILRKKMSDKGRTFDPEACENVIIWEEIASSGRAVQCRAKIDNFAGHIVTDLKSSDDVSPENISRTVANYRYPIQAASNMSGISAVFPELIGRVKFRWVFYETEAPYAVTRCSPSARDLALAGHQWRRAVDIWDRCLHSDSWPDYENEELIIEQPQWAATRIVDRLASEGTELNDSDI